MPTYKLLFVLNNVKQMSWEATTIFKIKANELKPDGVNS